MNKYTLIAAFLIGGLLAEAIYEHDRAADWQQLFQNEHRLAQQQRAQCLSKQVELKLADSAHMAAATAVMSRCTDELALEDKTIRKCTELLEGLRDGTVKWKDGVRR